MSILEKKQGIVKLLNTFDELEPALNAGFHSSYNQIKSNSKEEGSSKHIAPELKVVSLSSQQNEDVLNETYESQVNQIIYNDPLDNVTFDDEAGDQTLNPNKIQSRIHSTRKLIVRSQEGHHSRQNNRSPRKQASVRSNIPEEMSATIRPILAQDMDEQNSIASDYDGLLHARSTLSEKNPGDTNCKKWVIGSPDIMYQTMNQSKQYRSRQVSPQPLFGKHPVRRYVHKPHVNPKKEKLKELQESGPQKKAPIYRQPKMHLAEKVKINEEDAEILEMLQDRLKACQQKELQIGIKQALSKKMKETSAKQLANLAKVAAIEKEMPKFQAEKTEKEKQAGVLLKETILGLMRKHTRSLQLKKQQADSLSQNTDREVRTKISHSVEDKLRKSLVYARAHLKRLMSRKLHNNDNADIPMLRTITALSPTKLRRNSLELEGQESREPSMGRRRTKQHRPESIVEQIKQHNTLIVDKNQEHLMQLVGLFKGLNPRNFQLKYQQMMKKLNQLVAQKKQKQAQLAKLYGELDSITHINLMEDMAHLELNQKQPKNDKDYSMLFQNKLGQTLYDAKSAATTFDFANLDCILEHRQVLMEKIKLTDSRIQEEEYRNQQFKDMLARMHKDNLSQANQNQFLNERGKNMQQVVGELELANFIESQRRYDVEAMMFEYRKKWSMDKVKMDRIRDEKQTLLNNHEQDTKLLLIKIMNHLKNIKQFRLEIVSLEARKNQNEKREALIVEEFKKRQKQIEIVTSMAQLQKIQKYSRHLADILAMENEEGGQHYDVTRLKGLKLVEYLIASLKQIKKVPNFRKQTATARRNMGRSFDLMKKGNNQASPHLGIDCGKVHETGFQSLTGSITHRSNEEQNSLNIQLENYIQFKQEFDSFYAEFVTLASEINFQAILEINLQSKTRLQSLQHAFKHGETEKKRKCIIIEKIKKQIHILENEKQIVGEYLNHLDLGAQCSIRETLYVEIGDPVEDKKGTRQLGIVERFPQSMEVMKIYISGVQEKIGLLKSYKISNNFTIKSFYNGQFELMKATALRLKPLQDSSTELGIKADFVQFIKKFQFEENNKAKTPQRRQGKVWKKSTLIIKQVNSNSNRGKQHRTSQRTNRGQQSPESLTEADESFEPILYTLDTKQDEDNMSGISQGTSNEESKDLELEKLKQLSPIDRGRKKFKNKVEKISQKFPGFNQFQQSVHYDILFMLKEFKRLQILINQNLEAEVLPYFRRDDFDPVFRRKDNFQIRKAITNVLDLKKRNFQGEKGQAFILAAQQEKEMQWHYTLDEETREFKALPRPPGWRDPNRPDDGNDKDNDNKAQAIDYDALEDIEEQIRLKKQLAQTVNKLTQAPDTFTSALKYQKVLLQRQKNRAQAVQREEKFFMRDLKVEMQTRYDNLRKSFIQKYYIESLRNAEKQKKAAGEVNFQAPPEVKKFLDSRKASRVNATIDMQPRQLSPDNLLAKMQQLFVAQKLGSQNVHKSIQINTDSNDLLKGPFKRTIGAASVVHHGSRPTTKNHSKQRIRACWNADLAEQEQIQKPLKSVCFDFDASRPSATASIRYRIKVNKEITSGHKPRQTQTMRSSMDPLFQARKQMLNDSNMVIIQKSHSRRDLKQNPSRGMRSGSSGTRGISPENHKNYAVRIRDNLANLSIKAEALRQIQTRNRTSMGMSQDWAVRNSNYTQAMAFNLNHATQQKQRQFKQMVFNNGNQRHQSISDLSNLNGNPPNYQKTVQFADGRVIGQRYNKNITKPLLPTAGTSAKRPISTSGLNSKVASSMSHF